MAALSRRDAALLGAVLLGGASLPASAAAELSEEASLVVDAWAVVQRGYVDSDFNGVDWKAARSRFVKRPYKSMAEARAAVSEMLALLGDRYTRYVTPAGYEALTARFEARAGQGGIGVQLRATAAGVELQSVADGSAAAAAGLQPGDRVLAVDGRSVEGASAEDVAALVLGSLDEALRLELRRGAERLRFSLRRAPISSGDVSAQLVARPAGTVGLITIREFSDGAGGAGGTLRSLSAALEKVGASDTLLIDLRGNPGGHFPSGIEAAKLFLYADATVVATQGRQRSIRSPTLTDRAGPYAGRGKRTYLLVDKRTASAAEVFAAALQDNRAARVLGEPTFGKGLVQTIAKVGDGGAVVCTVARYVTPSGRDINGVGLKPDVPSACAEAEGAVECFARAVPVGS